MNLAGIDVANETFDIQKRGGEAITHRIFPNTKSGHQQAITWLRGGSKGVRVCLEATGIYHLQLALALDRAPGIELMVLNPKAARRFAEAQMVRGKTDKVDAMVLLNYLERMLFRPWSAPDEHRLVLQSMAHRLAQLTKEQVRERSRLHAAERAGPHTREAKHDIRVHIRYLKRRYQQLETKAIELMKQHATMAEDLKLIERCPVLPRRLPCRCLPKSVCCLVISSHNSGSPKPAWIPSPVSRVPRFTLHATSQSRAMQNCVPHCSILP